MSEINAIATNNYLLATPVGSGYMETSALEYDGDKISGYAGSAFKAGDEFPQSATEAIGYVTATSANIDSTIDNVSSNSGAWGGSALPISAGPGIKFEMDNDTLVASTDETVLWENTNNYFSATNSTGQFAYPLSAFEAIEFRCTVDNIAEQRLRFSSPSFYTKNLTVSWQEFYQNYRLYYLILSTDGNSFTGVSNCLLTTNGTVNQNLTVAQSNWQYGYVGLKKIIGINRIAGGN